MSARRGGSATVGGPDLVRERELLATLPERAVVLGVDEVGRGALAGPVSIGVCAVARDAGQVPLGLNDSKMLRPAVREALVEPVRAWSVACAVGHASPGEIDALGILAAQRLAAGRALLRVRASLDAAGLVAGATILDGRHDWLAEPAADLFAMVEQEAEPAVEASGAAGAFAALDPSAGAAAATWDVPVVCVVKGDTRCASVAGASVLAKVERDALMTQAAARPELVAFGLDGNKGYGSAAHLDALAASGASDWHRRSWRLPARREA